MRIAFLSDIHSNIQALEAVLAHLGQRAERVAVLGDIVGYNGNPNEVVAALRTVQALCVKGNHDFAVVDPNGEKELVHFNDNAKSGAEHSKNTLTPENKEWLRSLPWVLRLSVGNDGTEILMCHGSPRDPCWEYTLPWLKPTELAAINNVANNELGKPPAVIATGHTHLPMRLDHLQTIFLNPGSVGQPRDGDQRASYCILDTDTMETTFHRVAYSIEGASQSVKDAKLPDDLFMRLYRGA